MDAIRTRSRPSSPTSSKCKGASRTRTTSTCAACLALAGVILGGCSVGPNYHPPKQDTPPAFANGVQTNLAPAPIAITWWRGFNDEQLNQLVNQALQTNHDLRIATARLREARAFYGGAVADFFPVPEATASYNKSVSSKDSVPFPLTREQRELQLFSAGFDATWELDIFGRVRRSVEASAADVGMTEAARQDVAVSLIAEVALNYFQLRGQQHLLAVAEDNVGNQRDTLEIAQARARAGRATELDTARALAQLNATLAAIPPLEAAIQRSIHRLSVLTGQLPTALEAQLRTPAPIPTLPLMVNIGDPADLLRRRRDIRAAERSLAAATARIGVQVADLFPRVTFNGNVGLSANHLAGMGASGADYYSFGPQITWAALDIGHVSARIRASRAHAEAELAAYQKTVLTALEETENALVDFGREQARRDYLRESQRSAKDATDLARQRYEGGLADFLPVLDAQRTQLAVEAQLAQSETQTATDLIALYKALGGGWEIGSEHAAAGGLYPMANEKDPTYFE
jgi:multidrug efflux system outer membrane protein